ncbi:conserved hypothetical protein, partial [Ricinus communis]
FGPHEQQPERKQRAQQQAARPAGDASLRQHVGEPRPGQQGAADEEVAGPPVHLVRKPHRHGRHEQDRQRSQQHAPHVGAHGVNVRRLHRSLSRRRPGGAR